MLKFLSFASTMCCNSRSTDLNHHPINNEGGQTPKEDVEDDFMIWALKHHIDKYYKFNNKKRSENNVGMNTDCFSTTHNTYNFSETSEIISEDITTEKKLRLPLLNFDKLKNLNYDSEKEVYANMEDKIKKIKKRFELLKHMK